MIFCRASSGMGLDDLTEVRFRALHRTHYDLQASSAPQHLTSTAVQAAVSTPGRFRQRQHYPEPCPPGKPEAEQDRRRGADPRPFTEVILQPHPRLGHPGPDTRRLPATGACLIRATARRVMRSGPAYPIAVIFSCATSARIFP